MTKIIFISLLFITGISQGQSILKRTVDSSGNITISTTIDTLAMGPKDCMVGGLVYNADSIKYYALVFYFKAPKTFFLTGKDKIYIRFDDGQVYDENVYTNGEFFTEGNRASVTIEISEQALQKMSRCFVTSVSLINDKFRHKMNVQDPYNRTFEDLAYYLLDLNPYDENGINWVELTKMKFRDN